MRKPQPRPDYDKLVERILSGELTRLQAADISYEITGLKPKTFLSWLRSSGKLPELAPTRGNRGDGSPFSFRNPDNPNYDPGKAAAYDKAVAQAMSTTSKSVRAIAKDHGVNYVYLLRKLSKAKAEAAGTETADRLKKALVRAIKKIQ